MTVEAAIANYQSGKVPFVSVLEAMTALYADRWTRAGSWPTTRGCARASREASLEATPEMTTASAPAAAAQLSRAGWRHGRRDERTVGVA